MVFYAIVKERQTELNFHFMKAYSYDKKKDFLSDLRRNGYIVRHNKIYTEEEYNSL